MCHVKYLYHRFCRTILTPGATTGWSNPLPLTEPGSDSRRATIRDVAALAGVSIGTASKALNGQGKLRAETRDRVAAAAAELGFTPNVLARGLLAGRTYTVGLITTDSFGRFSIPVMLGAENALGAGQISVFMCDTRDDPARERQYVDMLLRRQVDGLIVTGRRIEPRPSIGTAPGHPGGVRDDPVARQRRAGHPARRPRRRRAGRPALRRRRAAPRRPHHRARALPGRPQAGGRLLEPRPPRAAWSSSRATCSTASGASAGAARRAEILLRNHPGRGRHLLRQRPARPRGHRHAAAPWAGASPTTSR